MLIEQPNVTKFPPVERARSRSDACGTYLSLRLVTISFPHYDPHTAEKQDRKSSVEFACGLALLIGLVRRVMDHAGHDANCLWIRASNPPDELANVVAASLHSVQLY